MILKPPSIVLKKRCPDVIYFYKKRRPADSAVGENTEIKYLRECNTF